MSKIKEIRHAVMGIAFTPRGLDAGGHPVAEVNETISKLAKGSDEVKVVALKNSFDEKGDPSFVLNEYFFITYEDETPAVKSKKADG